MIINDQKYLLSDQYNNANKLNARIQLHNRFSTNPYGWFNWVFDRIAALPMPCRLLELGCGPASLWVASQRRIPSGLNLILTDFSEGMLEQARQNMAGNPGNFSFKQVDAQSIPFEDNSFDVVLANHMLYHVPDRAQAIREIGRVLKPGGQLLATTVGDNHMIEIPALVKKFSPEAIYWHSGAGDITRAFTIQNGTAQLSAVFKEVRVEEYLDSLVVTEVDPLVDYILSGIRNQEGQTDLIKALRSFLAEELENAGGHIKISKQSGMFIATR